MTLVCKARASHFYAFFTQDHNEDKPPGFHPLLSAERHLIKKNESGETSLRLDEFTAVSRQPTHRSWLKFCKGVLIAHRQVQQDLENVRSERTRSKEEQTFKCRHLER